MKMETQENREIYLYRVLCILTGVVALFPVSCNYIMSGGIVTEWIARVEELAAGFQAGQLRMFPSPEVFAGTGIRVNGMDSNFWFLIPAVLYRLTGNIVVAYRIYMLAVQAGTLLGSMLLFRRIFAENETRIPAFFATLLYMTCPYRIYVCYDLANISHATAWMLLPYYVWAVTGLTVGGKKRPFKRKWFSELLTAALFLAGIGYADVIFFLSVTVITLLVSLLCRRLWIVVVPVLGSVCFLPGLHRLVQYLFMEGYVELDMPLKTIMANGYRFGEYFSSYSFRNGHAGMGLGMFLCLLTGAWLTFVKNERDKHGTCRWFLAGAAMLTILSFYYFPWDIFQRMGVWSLKLISLIDTPAIFWGMGFMCLCMPAACAMDRVSRHENKVIASAVPIMVMLACIGICVYQCNTLTYNRLPLTFP